MHVLTIIKRRIKPEQACLETNLLKSQRVIGNYQILFCER